MPLGEGFDLGGGYRVVREKAPCSTASDSITVSLPNAWATGVRLALVGEGGNGGAHTVVEDEPLSIGSAPDNAVVLRDRAVSRYHCRIVRDDGRSVALDELYPEAAI